MDGKYKILSVRLKSPIALPVLGRGLASIVVLVAVVVGANVPALIRVIEVLADDSIVLHIESLLGVLDEGGLCPALFLLAMEDLVLGIVEDLDSFEATLAIEHLIFVCPLALVAVVSLLLQRNHSLFELDSY